MLKKSVIVAVLVCASSARAQRLVGRWEGGCSSSWNDGTMLASFNFSFSDHNTFETFLEEYKDRSCTTRADSQYRYWQGSYSVKPHPTSKKSFVLSISTSNFTQDYLAMLNGSTLTLCSATFRSRTCTTYQQVPGE
jgi:hypothetical protein